MFNCLVSLSSCFLSHSFRLISPRPGSPRVWSHRHKFNVSCVIFLLFASLSLDSLRIYISTLSCLPLMLSCWFSTSSCLPLMLYCCFSTLSCVQLELRQYCPYCLFDFSCYLFSTLPFLPLFIFYIFY